MSHFNFHRKKDHQEETEIRRKKVLEEALLRKLEKMDQDDNIVVAPLQNQKIADLSFLETHLWKKCQKYIPLCDHETNAMFMYNVECNITRSNKIKY